MRLQVQKVLDVAFVRSTRALAHIFLENGRLKKRKNIVNLYGALDFNS